MKIKELIETLSELDPETLVVLAGDAEGNDFSPVFDYGPPSFYVPLSTWSGEIWDPEYEEHDDCEFEATGEDGAEVHTGECLVKPPEGAVPCIVLWPTN